MIIQGIIGKGTGKLGSSVFAINHGVQIAREYRDTIANPSTEAQVNQRSRFKLASQISEVMAPVIAIPRKVLLSPRNRFVKRNMPSFYGLNDSAYVTYENLQLTASSVGLPAVDINRYSGNMEFILHEPAGANIARVVYNVFEKTLDEKLLLVNSIVAKTAGANRRFSTTMEYMDGEFVVLAYGMIDNNKAIAAKYGNYSVATGEDIAQLVSNRVLNTSDYQLTQTRGNTIFAGKSQSARPNPDQFMVYVTSLGPGVVNWNGYPNDRAAFNAGSNCFLVANPQEDADFIGWRWNGEQRYFSYSRQLTLQVTGLIDIVAQFAYNVVPPRT